MLQNIMAVNDKIMTNWLKKFIAKSPVITSKIKKNFNIYLSFKTNKLSSFIKIPLINYYFTQMKLTTIYIKTF